MSPPQVHHRSPDCTVASRGPLLIQHWTGGAHEADVLAAYQAHRQVSELAGPGQMTVLAVADSVGHIPDEATRRRLAELAARTAGDIKRQAIVIRAQGFGASAVRSIVTAVFSLSRADYERRVFSDVGAACEWLAPGSGLSASELNRTFDHVAA